MVYTSIKIFDCSIKIFDLIALLRYLTVLLEYINALSMQHGICIADLAPAPLTPHPVLPTLNNTPYNIIMCALGDILSMIILQTGRL